MPNRRPHILAAFAALTPEPENETETDTATGTDTDAPDFYEPEESPVKQEKTRSKRSQQPKTK